MNKTAFAIRHVAYEDLGNMATVLKMRGYDIRYFDAGVDDLSDIQKKNPDFAPRRSRRTRSDRMLNPEDTEGGDL